MERVEEEEEVDTWHEGAGTSSTGHDTGGPQRGTTSQQQGAGTKKKISLLQYIKDELKRNYMLEYNEKKLRERRKRVYTFAKTPKELEKFLLFGLLLCLDVFLFIFTFLPIRLIIAALSALLRFCRWVSVLLIHIFYV